MSVTLWQIFAVTTWLAACCAAAFSIELSISYRAGIPLVLTGLMLTFGRAVFPRPPKRDHVDNEELLQKLSDIVVFGVPGSLLLLSGFSFLAGLMAAIFITVAVALIYIVSLFCS